VFWVFFPTALPPHGVPGQKATVPIYKVLVRPSREANSRPTLQTAVKWVRNHLDFVFAESVKLAPIATLSSLRCARHALLVIRRFEITWVLMTMSDVRRMNCSGFNCNVFRNFMLCLVVCSSVVSFLKPNKIGRYLYYNMDIFKDWQINKDDFRSIKCFRFLAEQHNDLDKRLLQQKRI